MLRSRNELSPKARWQVARIAASTPSAVKGLGSPEPPRLRARPATWAVCCAITAMSRLEVPTSSAVM